MPRLDAMNKSDETLRFPPSSAMVDISASTGSSCFADDEGSMHYDTSSMSSSSSSSSNVRSVHFRESVWVRDIEHINDLTDELKREVWFTANEYNRIRAEIRYTSAMLEQLHDGNLNGRFRDDDICIRGVECRTKAGVEEKRRRRKHALNVILVEQGRRAANSGCKMCFNQDRIAARYAEVTNQCKEEAHLRGLIDAENVKLDYTSLVLESQETNSPLADMGGSTSCHWSDSKRTGYPRGPTTTKYPCFSLQSPTSVCQPPSVLGYCGGSESERLSSPKDSIRLYKSRVSPQARGRQRSRTFGIHRNGGAIRPFF